MSVEVEQLIRVLNSALKDKKIHIQTQTHRSGRPDLFFNKKHCLNKCVWTWTFVNVNVRLVRQINVSVDFGSALAAAANHSCC